MSSRTPGFGQSVATHPDVIKGRQGTTHLWVGLGVGRAGSTNVEALFATSKTNFFGCLSQTDRHTHRHAHIHVHAHSH